MKNLVPLLSIAFFAACAPRTAGPHEHERGKVFFWEVENEATLTQAECSDEIPDLTPKYEAGSFFMYKLSEDGKSAIAQDCSRTFAETCQESETGIVFEVAGNELKYSPEPMENPLSGSTCTLRAEQTWSFLDNGESAELIVLIEFSMDMDNPDCVALENQAIAQSENDFGFDGCEIALTLNTNFVRVDGT